MYVFVGKMRFPFLQRVLFLLTEIVKLIDRRIDGREHVFVETAFGQSSACISPRKVSVGPARSVELLPGGDIVHFSIDTHHDPWIVLAIEFEQPARRIILKDDGLLNCSFGDRWASKASVEEIACERKQENI